MSSVQEVTRSALGSPREGKDFGDLFSVIEMARGVSSGSSRGPLSTYGTRDTIKRNQISCFATFYYYAKEPRNTAANFKA